MFIAMIYWCSWTKNFLSLYLFCENLLWWQVCPTACCFQCPALKEYLMCTTIFPSWSEKARHQIHYTRISGGILRADWTIKIWDFNHKPNLFRGMDNSYLLFTALVYIFLSDFVCVCKCLFDSPIILCQFSAFHLYSCYCRLTYTYCFLCCSYTC